MCRGPGVTSFQQMPEIKRKAPARRARKAPPAAAAAAPAYAGDGALERLLARAGKSAGIRIGSPRAVRDLLKGVLAAPVGHDPEAWMQLIAAKPPKALTAQLAALRARMAAAAPRPGLALPSACRHYAASSRRWASTG